MRGEKCKIQPKQTWSSNVKTPLVLTYLWFCKNKRNSRTEQHVSLAMIASQTSFLQWTDTTQRKCANFIYVRSLFCQGRGPRPAFQATIDSFISSLALIHIVQAQFSSNTFAQLWFCFLVFFWKRHVGSLISSNLSPSFFDNPVGGWRLNTRHPQRLFGPNTMHAASAAFMWGWIIPLRPVSRQEFPPGSPFLPTSGSLSLFFFFFFSCPCTRVISINLQCNICESLFISPFSLSLSLSLSLSVIWCLLTGLTQGSQVSPGPRCFAVLCGAGGCWTTGDRCFLETSRLGRSQELFQSHDRRHIHTKKWKHIPRNTFAVIFFGYYSLHIISSSPS